MKVATSEGEFELARDDKNGVLLRAVVPVLRDELSIVEGEIFPDGYKNPPSIAVPRDMAALHVSDFVAALTFLSDVRMSVGSRLDTEKLVPEDEADVALLAQFGTDRIHQKLRGIISARTFSVTEIEDKTFEKLLSRRAGLHLYEEAMQLERPVAKYRELWRVLESAFGRQHDALVDALAQYQPAIDLKFTQAELKNMLVLRGRASHAASKAGVAELREVNRAVDEAVGRLTALAEQVILTKKSWGYPTLTVERLAPLTGFVGPGNSINLSRPPF